MNLLHKASPSRIMANKLGADPKTIKLPTSNEPPSLPPTMRNPGRNNILNIIREQAESICIAGRDSDGHEERVAAMEKRLQRIVAQCFASYDNQPLLVVDVCEHGCVIDPGFGFVIDAGCPKHDDV